MKVLHYIPSIDRSSGGLGCYMQLLAQDLGKLADLHIATHATDHAYTMNNCKIHYIGTWKHLRTLKQQWIELLNNLQPDIVHINGCWIPTSALVQKWAQKKGYKVVLSPHGMLEPWIMQRHYWTRKWPAIKLYQQNAVKQADMIHVTAESEKENLLKLGWNNRISIVANGINVQDIKIKTSWKRGYKILFLSRIHPKKGIEFLLDAVPHLDKRLHVIIAGEGEATYIEQLKALAQERQITDRIQFIGGVYGDKKWELYQEADVFVLSTYSENFGIVVAEALASGTPVITTKGTPWAELESYRCGWWINIGTDPLVTAMQSFLSLSESELESYGRNGRRLIEEKYDSEIIANNMMALYQTVICPN